MPTWSVNSSASIQRPTLTPANGLDDLDLIAIVQDIIGMFDARDDLFVDFHGITLASKFQLVDQGLQASSGRQLMWYAIDKNIHDLRLFQIGYWRYFDSIPPPFDQ